VADGPSRKKNGCCNLSGDCAGSKTTAEPHLLRATEQRANRPAGERERTADSASPSRCSRLEPAAAVRSPGSGSASAALPLRT
jgi:hypothetical protein